LLKNDFVEDVRSLTRQIPLPKHLETQVKQFETRLDKYKKFKKQ